MLPPIDVGAGRVSPGLLGNHTSEPVRVFECQCQGQVSRRSLADVGRLAELKRLTHRQSQLGEELTGQAVVLLPPFGRRGWIGLPVSRQVEGDDAIARGQLLVLERVTPLVVVKPAGVLEQQGWPAARFEEEHLVVDTADLDGDVAADDR